MDELFCPLLGLIEGSACDLWDWMTDRVYEKRAWVFFFNGWRAGWQWLPRRHNRDQFFPRGWLPKT